MVLWAGEEGVGSAARFGFGLKVSADPAYEVF